MRIKIVRLIIILLFAGIGMDLLYIHLIKGSYLFNLSVNNRIRVVPLEEHRGRIFDRNGVVLAKNRVAFHVAVIPQDIQDSDRLFSYLSGVLKTKKQTLLQRFYQRKVTPFAPVIVAEDVEKKEAMVLEENKFRFPGLFVQEGIRRIYPQKIVGGHVIGYVGKINRSKIEKLKDYGYTPLSRVGYSGIEEYYDRYLRGKEGGLQIEVNSRGQQVRLLSLREPEVGEDIVLTIDHRVQAVASELLAEKVGAIVVMDWESGDVLGMVSSPAFDPNAFSRGRLSRAAAKMFKEETAPMLNRAIQGLYPPGSVYKAIVATAGLVTTKISAATEFFCKGSLKLGRQRFRCAHTHGSQRLVEAILHSCNVYFYQVGQLLGPETLHKYGRMFGLGASTDIDLPFEETGNVPSPLQRKLKYNQGWYKGDTLNFAIGQGDVLVTPLQLVRMMALFARSGRDVQPHLIQSIGKKRIVHMSGVKNLRIDPRIFATIQAGFRGAVSDPTGTARRLDMPGFPIFGKTGTAQSSGNKDHHAWFVGYTTTGNVKVVFCVFLEYGGSSYHAVNLARNLILELREQDVL